MKIPVSELLSLFRRMKEEHWQYVAGGASEGKVDCSGAFVYAYKQHGQSIYHGSNRIARTEVDGFASIAKAEVRPGMVAFKCRQPGQAGYSLPAEYQQGGARCNGDLNDYYHMGLIDADAATVLNAQSSQTGFVASPIGERWSHVGYLKRVDYGQDSEQEPDDDAPADYPRTATVYAENGSPVRIRNKPSSDEDKTSWDWVPIGAQVTVTGPGQNGFLPVGFGKKSGWMMQKFLLLEGDVPLPPSFSITIRGLSLAEAQALAERYPVHGPIQKEAAQ